MITVAIIYLIACGMEYKLKASVPSKICMKEFAKLRK